MLSYYEFIKGLFHWLGQSSHGPITPQKPISWQPSPQYLKLWGTFHIQTLTEFNSPNQLCSYVLPSRGCRCGHSSQKGRDACTSRINFNAEKKWKEIHLDISVTILLYNICWTQWAVWHHWRFHSRKVTWPVLRFGKISFFRKVWNGLEKEETGWEGARHQSTKPWGFKLVHEQCNRKVAWLGETMTGRNWNVILIPQDLTNSYDIIEVLLCIGCYAKGIATFSHLALKTILYMIGICIVWMRKLWTRTLNSFLKIINQKLPSSYQKASKPQNLILRGYWSEWAPKNYIDVSKTDKGKFSLRKGQGSAGKLAERIKYWV
jgi:hypothetical protein